jgi:hypothetical protein
MPTNLSAVVARLVPRSVRRAVTLVFSLLWIASVWSLLKNRDEPRWLELLFLVGFGLCIVIDRTARKAEEQTELEHD